MCTEHEESLKPLGLLLSRNSIDGCDSHKAESISFHETSKAHKNAEKKLTYGTEFIFRYNIFFNQTHLL